MMVHNLIWIEKSELNISKQLNIMYQIADNYGFQVELIDIIVKNKLQLQAINLVYPENQQS